MGQHASKSHPSLTFGYINDNQQQQQAEDADEIVSPKLSHNNSSDFVLDHPHLYQLEPVCMKHSLLHSANETVAVDEQDCTDCRQNKRASLVHRNLANDLSYIDKTYYPDIAHYIKESDIADGDDFLSFYQDDLSRDEAEDKEQSDTDTLRDEQGWSRLTMSEFTPNTLQRLVSSPLLTVDLSGKSLIKLSSSIGYLSNLTKLNISNNQMINLPRAISQLKNLRSLNASNNQLEYLPDTLALLPRLKAVNFSNNRLTSLPKGIGSLRNLVIILLEHNQIAHLPRELANLEGLVTLNISHNPLRSIPAEISTLKSLRKLRAEGCPFETEFVHQLAHDPPSLFETCARQVVKNKISLPPYLDHFADYFKREQTCSFCFGPFFDSSVTRGRFIERTNRQIIALDYQLCCAHWTDEEDRLSTMFSTPCYRTPSATEVLSDTPPLAEDYFTLQLRTSQQTLPVSALSDDRHSSSVEASREQEDIENYQANLNLQSGQSVMYQDTLPFVSLHSGQTDEANQILSRYHHPPGSSSSSSSSRHIQKPSSLEQNFVQPDTMPAIHQHQTRERSGTV